MMLTLVWLTIVAAACSSTALGAGNGSHSKNTSKEIHVNGTRVFRNLVPNQWTSFSFGQVDEQPFSYFQFAVGLGARCDLEVTDAYCPGDRFKVERMIFGNNVTEFTELLRTPVVPYNPLIAQEICDGFPVQCDHTTSDPRVAYNDHRWSSGRVRLHVGQYNVVVKPLASPYCSGGAFIRLRCRALPHPTPTPTPPPPPPPSTVCPITQGGMHVVRQAVPVGQAAAVCTAQGMTLAPLNNGNMVAASNVAFACSGANSITWVGSWDGWDYGGIGLGMTTGNASPGATINVYNDGSSHYVLCMENQA
jgi:hypothetical protein